MATSIAEIDQGVANIFAKTNEVAEFEDELTDITKEKTVEKLADLFE